MFQSSNFSAAQRTQGARAQGAQGEGSEFAWPGKKGGCINTTRILLRNAELNHKMWWSQVKIREMQHDQHWGKEHSLYLSLKHWDNLPREAVKSTLVLKDFQWSLDHPKQPDLPLKLAWLSDPLWPKLLWLMNQSATSCISQPQACWTQADCQLISTNKGCRLYRLPEGSGCYELHP